MNRYAVVITNDADATDKVNTFTWGETRERASERLAEQMAEQGIWEGWTAEVK